MPSKTNTLHGTQFKTEAVLARTQAGKRGRWMRLGAMRDDGHGTHTHTHTHIHTHARTFLSRLSQNEAISSALELPATDLLQKPSKASFRDLWKRDAFMKQVDT
eukprot:1160284-Pelagomonas_calceolata.AAC.7